LTEQKNAFIFDLEGVLINHTKRQCEVATKALASVGIEFPVTPAAYQLRSLGEFHITRDFVSGLYIMQKHNIRARQAMQNPDKVARLRAQLTSQEWKTIDAAVKNFDVLRSTGKLAVGKKVFRIVSGEPPLQKIRQMLYWAARNGHPIVMVTAGKKRDAISFMVEAGIMGYFKAGHLFFGEDKVKKGGLFAEASKLIEQRYGVRRGRQFVIEDSLSGIADAKANRLRSVLVLTGNTPREKVLAGLPPEKRPTLVLEHAKDILGTLAPTKRGLARRRKARGKRQQAIRQRRRK
jgi:beta-phosphoglucomutase-like phosphatase (HAD superfamily)